MPQHAEPGTLVHVRFAGTWYEAEILSWSLEQDNWWANVRWWPPSGKAIRGTFPQHEVVEIPATPDST
jgi:hypothetical protein